MNRFSLSVVFLAAILVNNVSAQDQVITRSADKPVKGAIKTESASGVVVGKDTIAAADIIDILYAAEEVSIGGPYAAAKTAERDSLDASKDAKTRKDKLQLAIDKYQESIGKVADPKAKRHFTFKAGYLQARMAMEAGGDSATAIASLQDFKTKFPSSWQIAQAMQTLAQLQTAAGQYPDAAATYEELADMDIGEEAKVQALIQSASTFIKAKDYDTASKKVEALRAKIGAGSPSAVRADILQGQVLAAKGDLDGAMTLLRGIVNKSADKGVKAAAYNTLGECLMGKEQYKDARWEFLWVDLVYNQDRNEHAHALFNLAKTFDVLGEGDRALECRELLANDSIFAGLDYQRQAQSALGGPAPVEKKGKTKKGAG